MEVKEPSAKYLARPRYKQSEVGPIPEDWSLRPMLSVIRIASGQVDPKVEPYRSMTLVAPDHVESGTGRLLMKETAGDQQAISGKYLFTKGDIVYSKIRPYLRKAILADFEGLCSADMYPMRPASDVSGGFMLAAILGHHFSRYAESVSVRSGMPKINRSELAEYIVALPPTKAEQEAIAEAFSDADALIESLEQLLAKKRHVKQGAMQELLTGKTRLPGFRGEWESRKLEEVGRFLKGSGVAKHESLSGGIRCVRYGELYTRHDDYIREFHSWIPRTVADSATQLAKGDILFAGSGETKEEIGKCAAFVHDVEAYAGGDIIILRPEGADSLFLGYYLNSAPIRRQKASKGQGDAVVHIAASALGDIRVLLPSLKEQSAISTVLCDIDSDIAALGMKLAKARRIKQGMMQELLSGRVRLAKCRATEESSC